MGIFNGIFSPAAGVHVDLHDDVEWQISIGEIVDGKEVPVLK